MKIKKKLILLFLILIFFTNGFFVLIIKNSEIKQNKNITKDLIRSSNSGREKIWNITWGGSYSDSAEGIAIDSSENIYVAGMTMISSDNRCVFLAKYNSSGDQIWNKKIGLKNYQCGEGYVAVDRLDNVYLTWTSFNFDTMRGDTFLSKYNSIGTEQWTKKMDFSNYDVALDIEIDDSNNVYVVGKYGSMESDSSDVFIAKYNQFGIQQWYTTWGRYKKDQGNSIALDNYGNIYIGVSSFDHSDGSRYGFIIKYNNSGIEQWDITCESSSSGELSAIMDIYVDNFNNIYVVGGGGFLAKYNTSRIQQWNITSKDVNRYFFDEIAVYGSNSIYVAGWVRIGGISDAYLTKYNNTGTQQWNIIWGGNSDDTVFGLAYDCSGNIYIAGETDSYGSGESDAFLIKYENIAPVFASTPDDILYYYGSSGHVLKWNITDTSVENPTYTIYHNAIPIPGHINETWTSGKNISVNIDGLSLGDHDFTIIVSDGLGEFIQDKFDLIVYSNIAPVFASTPDDILYYYGSSGHVLKWNITDTSVENPTYTIYHNAIPIPGHINETWTSGKNISVNIDGLSLGDHNFTIIVSDGLGEFIQDDVIISVYNENTQSTIDGFALYFLFISIFLSIVLIIQSKKGNYN